MSNTEANIEATEAVPDTPDTPDTQPVFDLPDPPLTGDPDVDEAIAALARAIPGPLEEQVAVYDAAHRTLQDRLADVEG